MNVLARSETPQTLIRAAKRQGFAVTRTQLARWQRNGVLPRPTQVSLGRHGSKVEYPAGSEAQLLALCRYRRFKRDLPAIRWRLWWDGFSIPLRVLKRDLHRVVGELARWRSENIDQEGLPNLAGEELARRASTGRLKNKIVARSRRRVGKPAFGQVFETLLLLFSPSSRLPEDADRQELVDRAIGFEKVRRQRGDDVVSREYLPQVRDVLDTADAFTLVQRSSGASLERIRFVFLTLRSHPAMEGPSNLLDRALDLDRFFGNDRIASADDYAFFLLNLIILLPAVEQGPSERVARSTRKRS